MLTGIPLGDQWQVRVVSVTRWNQYTANWPVVLDALRQLWELGKVSELKSPFYELVEYPANK